MKYDNQLRYTIDIVKAYDGRHPLSAWLKNFFRENKQMGSCDRKTISSLLYGYFRLGHNEYKNVEERMLAGLFANTQLQELANYFKATRPVPEQYRSEKIFPWPAYLSEGIDAHLFAESFLIQPDLFIRLRPGKEKSVIDKLQKSSVAYSSCGANCIALPNSTKTDALFNVNADAVVQDKSSQQTFRLLDSVAFDTVWDCCAASGGKSIMAYDINNRIDLTVSDIREKIISSLHDRLMEAGVKNYHSFVADLSSGNAKLPDRQYDLIIADVPCTGSGTWSRTPEQLYFFEEQKIAHYTRLQQQIVGTALKKLRPGGHLLYITCSVFRQENEEMASAIQANENIALLKKELIRGYDQKADTMFAALFTNAPASR